jgi:hypothetical protein
MRSPPTSTGAEEGRDGGGDQVTAGVIRLLLAVAPAAEAERCCRPETDGSSGAQRVFLGAASVAA